MRHQLTRGSATRLLLTTDCVGGVWTYSRDMATALAREGVSVVLAVVGPAPSAAQRRACEERGLMTIVLGGELDWTASSDAELDPVRTRILDVASACGADLVQVHAPSLVPVRSHLPVIAVAHSCIATWWARVRGDALPTSFEWHARATAEGLNRADAVVAPSHAFARDLRDTYGLARDIRVVHNGRPQSTQEPSADAVNEVFATGRVWDEAKNLALLDRIAPVLDCKTEIAGATTSPSGQRIELRHAHALGSVEEAEVRRRLARRPVFASPALYEPFGLGVLEAAQAGCALVLADQPTFRELWNGCALFADARDDGAFAEAIGRVLRDTTLREALGRSARERARQFRIEESARALTAILSSLASAAADCPA